MSVTHTPTPWALGDSPLCGNGFCTIDAVDPTDGVGFIVCEVYGIDHGRIPCPTSEANAAYIVKAVNAHDKLVEAARALIKYDATEYTDEEKWRLDYTDLLAKAKGALRAAGEPV
jgi:hypothetical protein